INARHVNQHAPFEGDRLPVIARATAPNGQWNSMFDRRRYHGSDFLLAPRLNDNVRHAMLQLRRKHGAVPMKIVRLLADLSLVNRRIDIADVPTKLRDMHLICHTVPWKFRSRRSSSLTVPEPVLQPFMLN